MPFSDDDLNRLKKDFMDCDCTKETQQTYSIGHLRLLALLARLSAAESALAKATPFFDMNPTRIGEVTQTGTHIFTDAYDAWKKAAGK